MTRTSDSLKTSIFVLLCITSTLMHTMNAQQYFSKSVYSNQQLDSSIPQRILAQNEKFRSGLTNNRLLASNFNISQSDNNLYYSKQLQGLVENSTYKVIPQKSPRLELHLSTDKDVYRPVEVIFSEVYVVNALTKTPVAIALADQKNPLYNLTLEIYNTSDNKRIYNTTAQTLFSTAAFSYKIPANFTSGDYIIKVFNSQIPAAYKLVTIVEYKTANNTNQDQIYIYSIQNKDSYKYGDQVNGKLVVGLLNGSDFQVQPTYSYVANFSNSQSTLSNQQLNSDGAGFFSFVIPKTSNARVVTITFTVRAGNISQDYVLSLNFPNINDFVIDFILDNAFLAPNITNKVYYSAWSDSNRVQPVDFVNASLKYKTTDAKKVTTETILLDKNITSIFRGKGSFFYNYVAGVAPYLEITIQNQTIQRNLTFQGVPQANMNNEISFNSAKRLNFYNDPFILNFFTNNQMNSSSVYLLQLKNKDQIIFQQFRQFNASSQYLLQKINPLQNGVITNGAVVTLTLYKVSDDYFKYAFAKNQTPSNPATLPPFNDTILQKWLQPKGELLLFVPPRQNLKFVIKTNKQVYNQGDLVNYEINIIDPSTNATVKTDTYVSIKVTDASVDDIPAPHESIPELIARLYFENELVFNDQYGNGFVDNLFQPYHDIIIDILFGLQVRNGEFDLSSIYNTNNTIQNLNQMDRDALQRLYAFVFPASPNTTQITNGSPAPLSEDLQEAFSCDSVPTYDGQATVANPRQWAHALRLNQNPTDPIDQTKTVLFTSAVVAKAGVLKGTFYLSDSLTKFRINAQGFNALGLIGQQQSYIETQESFFVQFDLPPFMVAGDSLKIRVNITNLGLKPQSVRIYELINDPQLTIQVPTAAISVAAGKTATTTIVVTAKPLLSTLPQDSQVLLLANSTLVKVVYSAKAFQKVSIIGREGITKEQFLVGFIGSQSKSKLTPTNASVSFNIPYSYINGSSMFSAKIFSSNFALAADAMIDQYYETTETFDSAAASLYSIFQSITALQQQPIAIKNTDDYKIKLFDLNMYLQMAYQRLLSFTTFRGGFSRYYGGPADVVLSAQGLAILTEINRVLNIVDPTVLASLRTYILSMKNGKGGFIINPIQNSTNGNNSNNGTKPTNGTNTTNGTIGPKGHDHNGDDMPVRPNQTITDYMNLPDYTTNAYIVWGLTQAGVVNVTDEVTALINIANNQTKNKTQDAYLFALLATSLYNLKRPKDGLIYADQLVTLSNADGSISRAVATVTNAGGYYRTLETTTLAILAWQNNIKYATNIQNAIQYIASQGTFGPGQTSIVTLNITLNYLDQFPNLNGVGNFTLRAGPNRTLLQAVSFTPSTFDTLEFNITDIAIKFPNLLKADSDLNITLSVENFTIAVGQTKDFRVIFSLDHIYLDNNQSKPVSNSSAPKPTNGTSTNTTNSNTTASNATNNTSNQSTSKQFGLNVQLVNKTNLGKDAFNGKQFIYTVTLSNPLNISGPFTFSLRHASCLAPLFRDIDMSLRKANILAMVSGDPSQGEINFLSNGIPNGTEKFDLPFIQAYAGTCQSSRLSHSTFFYSDQVDAWTLAA